MSDSVAQEVFTSVLTERRDYTKVRSPALAIYAMTMLDVHTGDSVQRAKMLAWEQKYMAPFRGRPSSESNGNCPTSRS
jgi:hypothetical protein